MDSWYLTNLVCPRDSTDLDPQAGELICRQGHRYPVVDGIPVLLLDDVEQTISVAKNSMRLANGESDWSGLYLDSVGISPEEKRGVMSLAAGNNGIVDPVAAFLVSATSGLMYKPLIGKLGRYPIPDIPLSEGHGRSLLDVGCNWGRWSIAAARRGWEVVGIDPSLGAIMSARRVARSMNLPIRYVVGDGRFLPFPPSRFTTVFSFGVLQHLSEQNAVIALREMARVLAPLGTCLVQMPNSLGVRSMYQLARRRFRAANDFDVRYWRIRDLRAAFLETIGPAQISIDAFGGIGIHKSDWDMMPLERKLIIAASETLRTIGRVFPFLVHFADSVYVRSTKSPDRSVGA